MKLFKILLLIVFTFSISLTANQTSDTKSFKYNLNYKYALAQAKAQDKPLMLVIEEKYCPWCKKLKEKTFANPVINAMIKKDFIVVKLTDGQDDIPNKFYADVFPTVYFINPQNNEFYFKKRGYRSAIKYKKTLIYAMKVHNDR
ncbi:MAG TPA: thioredoxin family protein [Arcobacter sp.]|nr:thioredoxin family protein [Arcobacter sp.]